MKLYKNNSGFTLIELILVIVILGVLAVSVAPKFVGVQAAAFTSQADATVGAIRDAIVMKYAENLVNDWTPLYPDRLDPSPGGPASAGNPLFINVLKEPITSGWERFADSYRHLGTGQVFTYFKTDGSFVEGGVVGGIHVGP